MELGAHLSNESQWKACLWVAVELGAQVHLNEPRTARAEDGCCRGVQEELHEGSRQLIGVCARKCDTKTELRGSVCHRGEISFVCRIAEQVSVIGRCFQHPISSILGAWKESLDAKRHTGYFRQIGRAHV